MAKRRVLRGLFRGNQLLLASCVFALIILPGIWFTLQSVSELSRSYDLTADVNEIQWRGHQIMEELVTMSGLLALASATKSHKHDPQTKLHSQFLDANISALLTQPFLVDLISKRDIDYLKTLSRLVNAEILPGLSQPNSDYDRPLSLINEFLPEVRRITTLANTASYVRARTAAQSKEFYLVNFTYAIFAAAVLLVMAWLSLLYRSKAQYNDSVRQFSLLFSHMTVTRINGLNFWSHESLTPDEYPDAILLEKARNRIENLTVMSQWLSRIAFPRADQEDTSLVSIANIVADLGKRSGQPKPVLLTDRQAAGIKVPEAHYHLILQELVSNAQDALAQTFDPKITIHAFVNRTPFGQKRLTIKVEDNGPGMSKEQISNAVTPFCSTKSEANSHSGLGLYGCMQMVRTMCGKFSISSSPRRGTIMQFSCPIYLNK